MIVFWGNLTSHFIPHAAAGTNSETPQLSIPNALSGLGYDSVPGPVPVSITGPPNAFVTPVLVQRPISDPNQLHGPFTLMNPNLPCGFAAMSNMPPSPISIPGPPPESIDGQPPYCISGPQNAFGIESPLSEECSASSFEQLPPVNDFSLKLKPGTEVRNYQWELAAPGIRGENYVVVAPTGCGKTLVAALVISEHLKKTRSVYVEGVPQSKVIFMVRTKPLANQQRSELTKLIPDAKVVHCVGECGWIYEMLPHSDIIVCTAGKLLVELQQGKVKMSQISLLMIDECHHVTDNYQKVMQNYLEEKEKHGKAMRLPQIIGLTASPGAGDNKMLELNKTIEHLVTLCALMDATSGIKIVRENRVELELIVNKPSFTLDILNRRDENEEFVSVVTREMTKLEQYIDPKLKCLHHPRWSQAYEVFIQQRANLLEHSLNEKFRDQISILKVLRCYSLLLNMYMDMRNVDAISIIEEFEELPTDDSLATPMERSLKQNVTALTINLKMLPTIENPFLRRVEDKLRETFSTKRDSKGIVFVPTKKHAAKICNWLSTLHSAITLGIKPLILTGHKRDNIPGMTQVEQEGVMKSFHNGDCNILVATSVAEEGLDVPACNLVIRFQHVSNEIAKVQTVGRARAADGEGLTILSSNSKKHIREIRTDERLALVEVSLEEKWIPSGEYLTRSLQERQRELLYNLKIKRKLKQQMQQMHAREAVRLFCKKCKTFACYGSDIFSSETVTQYLVPREDFRATKIVKRLHHTPGILSENVAKTHKVHCQKCDYDWGIMCFWHNENYEFPILKCKSFIFEVNGEIKIVPKWSNAPFEMYPLTAWLALEMEDSDDSEGSDNE